MTLKKILVPLDGSKNSFRALDEAIIIGKKFNSTISLIHVLPTAPFFSRKPLGEINDKLRAEAHNFLLKAKNKVKKSDITVNSRIAEWVSTGPYIVDFAQKNKFELIVIGSRGMGSAKEFFLGSTSHYVVHKSKIPVLVIK